MSNRKKKHSLRPVVLTAYTLEIRFFTASAFEGLYVVPFQTEQDTVKYVQDTCTYFLVCKCPF